MRQLTAYASYLDNLGAPLVGRARFYNLDDSPAVVYGLDNAHQQYVELGHIVYTNSSGQLVPQVFLADHDYLVVFDKYIGGGTMSEDDDPDSWPEQGSAVDKYNTVGISLDGASLRTAETISSLRSLIPTDYPTDTKEVVTLLGYSTKGDKPEINYIWDAYSTDNDNGGSIIKVDGIAVGRWVLVDCPRYLDVRHFGAFPKGSSDQDDIQCGRIQLAGAYAHSNNCGLYFYGDSLNAYYDISGLTLYDIDADDDAMVFAMSGREATLHKVINIHCATNQYTTVSNQGRINLYGRTLRTSFAPHYNVLFGTEFDGSSERIVIDSDVETSNLDIWNVAVEVTYPTTSHWIFHNTPIESIHCIGNNVTFTGWTRLARDMFLDDVGMDFSTITISGNDIVIDIDDFRHDTAAWCKLVIQQDWRDFDIKGYTLNSDCNLNFSSGKLILHNAKLNAFACSIALELKDCEGTLAYSGAANLSLDGCSDGIVLTSANMDTNIYSRYSRLEIGSGLTVNLVDMLGGRLYSSSYTLAARTGFKAVDTIIYCTVHGISGIQCDNCVIASNVEGKAVAIRSCTFMDANVTVNSPYDSSSNTNVINASIIGNKFIGTSLFKMNTVYASPSVTTYTVSIEMSGNYSDHDFVDDSAFNGVTHNVNVAYCVYKGNYGGCPTESGYGLTSITYTKETLSNSSPGECGAIPSAQADNSVAFYTDQRPSTVAGWAMNVYWWCLKVNRALTLASFNMFGFTYLNVKTSVRVRPKCVCTFKPSAPNNQSYGDNPIVIPMLVKTGSMNKSGHLAYQEDFAMDYGMATDINIGQRERYMLTVVTGSTLPAKVASIEWIVDQTGFEG